MQNELVPLNEAAATVCSAVQAAADPGLAAIALAAFVPLYQRDAGQLVALNRQEVRQRVFAPIPTLEGLHVRRQDLQAAITRLEGSGSALGYTALCLLRTREALARSRAALQAGRRSSSRRTIA